MGADNLIFRLATPEEDGRVLDLFEESFGRRLPFDWWQWYNHDAPTGPNRNYVAEDTTRHLLVAAYGLLPIRLWLNGNEVKASLCTNVCTHPEYRGCGLFTRMGEHALSSEREYDTPVTVGMPNLKALPGHMKVGWWVQCMLPFLVKRGPRNVPHDCGQVDRFSPDVDALIGEIRGRFDFLILKDHRYLNWRTADRPDREYALFEARTSGRLDGFMVLKHFDEGDQLRSHILELHGRTENDVRRLAAAAEDFAAGRDELNLWTNPNDPYGGTLRGCGFEVEERNDRLIMHANSGEAEMPGPGGWSFVLADNDVY